MEDLASLIDETRINVSKVLNDLQGTGIGTTQQKGNLHSGVGKTD